VTLEIAGVIVFSIGIIPDNQSSSNTESVANEMGEGKLNIGQAAPPVEGVDGKSKSSKAPRDGSIDSIFDRLEI
jgi:hypothetical protein